MLNNCKKLILYQAKQSKAPKLLYTSDQTYATSINREGKKLRCSPIPLLQHQIYFEHLLQIRVPRKPAVGENNQTVIVSYGNHVYGFSTYLHILSCDKFVWKLEQEKIIHLPLTHRTRSCSSPSKGCLRISPDIGEKLHLNKKNLHVNKKNNNTFFCFKCSAKNKGVPCGKLEYTFEL